MGRSVSVPAALAVILLTLLIFTCGCGDYVSNHDVIVIRLAHDGSTAWTRTLDTGFDDVAGDIAEAPGGVLIIAGGNASRLYESPVAKLTRLAADGSMLSDIPCPGVRGEFVALAIAPDGTMAASSYNGEVALIGRDGRILTTTETGLSGFWSLSPSADGGFVVAGQSWDQYPAGTVPEYDANGTLSTRVPQGGEVVITPGCRETIIGTGDRKVAVTECAAPVMTTEQAALVFLDRNGTIVTRHGYGASGLGSFWSIAPAADGGGYYLSAFSRAAGPDGFFGNRRYAAYIRSDGTPGWISDLGAGTQYFPSVWDIRQDSVRAIIPAEYDTGDNSTGTRPELLAFGPGGEVTGRQLLNASRIITPARDGGFFSAGVPVTTGASGYYDGLSGSDPRNELHAIKLSADGAVEWDHVVLKGMDGTIVRALATADGGYAILALRQNRV
jgi:hypothetical protein